MPCLVLWQLVQQDDASLGTMGEKRGEGLRDPVFVQVDLVEEVPTAQDGQAFDLIFVR